jgi:hypothetical protein
VVTVATQTVTLEQAAAPTCTYGIKPAYYDAGRGPDDIRVNVTAEDGCPWTATTGGAGWVTITEGRSGAGNGTARLLVEANAGPARAATLTIAGKAFALTQTGCPASIKPTWYEAGRGPDDVRIKVTAAAGCSWVTTNSAPWVTVATGSSGTGDGTVRLLLEANTGAARATTLEIAAETFTLRQEGAR